MTTSTLKETLRIVPAAARRPIILIAVGYVAIVILLLATRDINQTDIKAYHRGASDLRAGLPLYKPALDVSQDALEYLYPPLLAQLLYPISSMSLLWWLWGGLELLSLAGTIALIVRFYRQQIQEFPTRWILWGLGGMLMFPPLIRHFIWGQLQLTLLFLMAAAWFALSRKRDVTAGICLGIAIAFKIYPGLALIPLALHWRWRAVVAAAITSALLLGLSFAAIGWEQTRLFLTFTLPEASRQHDGPALFNLSIKVNLMLWLNNQVLVDWLALILRGAVLAIFVWAAARYRRQTLSLVLLSMTVVVLISPVVWDHYFVLLTLPWIAAWVQTRGRESTLLRVVYLLTASGALVNNMPAGLVMNILHMLTFIGTCLLFWLQLRLLRAPAADDQQSPGPLFMV